MPVTITAVDWSDPDAAALRENHRAEAVDRDGGDGGGGDGGEPAPPPSDPDVALLLLARDRATGVPVACVGLWPMGDGAAEITQMYVVPQRRGEGLSRHLLAALEAEAGAFGWHVLRLRTGLSQPAAIALFSRSGYERIASWPSAASGDSVYFEKRLAPSSR